MTLRERIEGLRRLTPKGWNEWMPTEDPDGDLLDRDEVLAVVADSLDAAWAEAEAALANDRPGIRQGFVEMLNRTARYDAERWSASGMTDQGGWIAFGPTPAAALRALAAKLR